MKRWFFEPKRGRFLGRQNNPDAISSALEPEEAIFPNLKEIAFSAEKAIYRTWKGTLSLGAKTILTQYRATWRPEKAVFPNLKEIAFSAKNAIFPNLKANAFSGRQNNRDAISSVLETWKAIFPNLKETAFSAKKRFFESERGRLFRASEQPWWNSERLGDLKKLFFETGK